MEGNKVYYYKQNLNSSMYESHVMQLYQEVLDSGLQMHRHHSLHAKPITNQWSSIQL